MIKRQWLLLLLCLLLLPGASLGEAYAFPYAGVCLASRGEWTVLTPETLDEQASRLDMMGVDIDTLKTDYAVLHTICEVFFPDGATVSLSAVQTTQSASWDSVDVMSPAEKESFLAAFSGPPYEHTGWSRAASGFLRCDFSTMSGGVPMYYARLITVRAGRLYMLTARARALSTDALHAVNETVCAALTFIDIQEAEVPDVAPEIGEVPDPILDDGVVTPIELPGFTGISTSDSSTIVISSLPGTDFILKTANDSLRAKTDEVGNAAFTVSTRRVMQYTYTLTGVAEGRKSSVLNLVIDRRLSEEDIAANYRKSARTLSSIGYAELAASPSAYEGVALAFQGLAASFTDRNGTPCVLFYAGASKAGEWENPLYVLFEDGAIPLSEGAVMTVYGDVLADPLPYTGEDGSTLALPAIAFHSFEP